MKNIEGPCKNVACAHNKEKRSNLKSTLCHWLNGVPCDIDYIGCGRIRNRERNCTRKNSVFWLRELTICYVTDPTTFSFGWNMLMNSIYMHGRLIEMAPNWLSICIRLEISYIIDVNCVCFKLFIY